MNQDGKPEHRPASTPSDTPAGGKVLLTLCTPPENPSPYQHATIRFPASYQEACMGALKVFAAYIPPHVEAVSLRQAVRRADGQTVWSIIPEDDWEVLLERHGEEVGVFLPHMNPQTVPYRKVKPPSKLIRFRYIDSTGEVHVVKAVNSLNDCMAFRDELCQKNGWGRYQLFYDERMLGSEIDQSLYRSCVNLPGQRPKWRPLEDVETFKLLLDMHPDPLWIYIEIFWTES